MSYPYSSSGPKQRKAYEPLEFDFRTDYSPKELIKLGDWLIEIFPQEKLLSGEKIDWSEIINLFNIDALKKAHPLLLWVAFWGLQKKKRLILDQEFSLGYSKTSTHFKFSLREFDKILLEIQVYLFAIIFCLQEDEQESREYPSTTFARDDGEKRFIFGEPPRMTEMLFSKIGSLILPILAKLIPTAETPISRVPPEPRKYIYAIYFPDGTLRLDPELAEAVKAKWKRKKLNGFSSSIVNTLRYVSSSGLAMLALIGTQGSSLGRVCKIINSTRSVLLGQLEELVVQINKDLQGRP